MNKILTYLVLTASLLAYGTIMAQDTEKKIKPLLKDAKYALDGEDYLSALQGYKKVLRLDDRNEDAGLNAALCIFKLNYSADSALGLIYNLSASKLPDAKYFLAKINHKQKRFNEAIALLDAYKKTDPKQRQFTNEEADYLAEQCANAKIFTSQPHLSVIKNMGPNINSAFDDYVPIVMPDETALYFTSKRKGSTGNKKNGDNNYFEDIYVAHKPDSVWRKAENLGFPVNTDNNDACVAISPDGHRMIIYRTSPDGASGDLYLTRLGAHEKWDAPVILGPEINSEYVETSACFSNDTNEIYFSSNRPGGYGGRDIYRVRKLPNGHWAMPFNLGSNVNTAYDEDAPFLHPDGITLYFSSKGHNTIGDYDVFKSTLLNESNQFTKAENLGFPINDVDNDIFFVLSVDAKRGYYSSAKKGTLGGSDVYQVDTRFGDNDLVVKLGYVYLENATARVRLALIDPESNEVAGEYFSNENTGKFIMVLNPLKSYKIEIEEDGYERIDAIIKPAALEPLDQKLKFRLKKINAK